MAATDWILMRDAYERYKASVKAPIRFDSFRRWVAEGKIRARKPAGSRFKEISLHDLNREISKLRGISPKSPGKRRVTASTKVDRPRRGRKKKVSFTDNVLKALGDAHLKAFLVTKKRPDLVTKVLDNIEDNDVRRFMVAYLSALERRALQGPEHDLAQIL